MPTFLLLLRLLTAVAPLDASGSIWAYRVGGCLAQSTPTVWSADADLLAFACGEGERRLVVMANGSAVPQDVVRETTEPLVPVFASDGDPAAIASLLITLFDAGGVQYSNRIPPRTVVVFRSAAEQDVRPAGVAE